MSSTYTYRVELKPRASSLSDTRQSVRWTIHSTARRGAPRHPQARKDSGEDGHRVGHHICRYYWRIAAKEEACLGITVESTSLAHWQHRRYLLSFLPAVAPRFPLSALPTPGFRNPATGQFPLAFDRLRSHKKQLKIIACIVVSNGTNTSSYLTRSWAAQSNGVRERLCTTYTSF